MVKENRERVIVDNLKLVHSVAKRFRGRGIDYDDLYQAGCVGLIKAVDGFDSERGFAFSTYAVPVIMGEIKRLFRDGGSIKISRSLREKAIKAQSSREMFINKHLREPTMSELSKMCDCSEEELCQALNVLSPVISLNCDYDDSESEIDVPFDDTEAMFDKLSLECAALKLSDKERKLLKLRYYEGKTQCECACAMSVSQVQISRREKELLKKLKILLE
ncbi:MAG: sigma-70 family RNA polymerase sigma factor [Eubacterium sp.]|nr:sigma-70 family RNA polymerase sigma factor [Eubacterium sp.]